MVSLGFAIGIVITIAEPSVQVLGQQVYDISDGDWQSVADWDRQRRHWSISSLCAASGRIQAILLSIDGYRLHRRLIASFSPVRIYADCF